MICGKFQKTTGPIIILSFGLILLVSSWDKELSRWSCRQRVFVFTILIEELNGV